MTTVREMSLILSIDLTCMAETLLWAVISPVPPLPPGVNHHPAQTHKMPENACDGELGMSANVGDGHFTRMLDP